jgi:hypothetical protein
MENAARRGPGRVSLTRCTMKHGEGFVDSPSNAPSPHPKCGGSARRDSRRWSAVSQRVPRDAHQRFVKTDVLGNKTQHPGRRDAVSVDCWRMSGGTRVEHEKPPRPGRSAGKLNVQSPRKEPAKASWRKAVATRFASTDARERDSIPPRSADGESTEAPVQPGQKPDRGPHTSNGCGDGHYRPAMCASANFGTRGTESISEVRMPLLT